MASFASLRIRELVSGNADRSRRHHRRRPSSSTLAREQLESRKLLVGDAYVLAPLPVPSALLDIPAEVLTPPAAPSVPVGSSNLAGPSALAAPSGVSLYWHYLTHPADMDDGLENWFYGFMGVSAAAGVAAGGMVIAGVDVVLVGGGATAAAAGGGAAAASATGGAVATLPEGGTLIGWVVNNEIVVMSLPNTSHAVLGASAGAVVDGAAVEGAYAFTVLKSGGQIYVLGSQNFGGVLSLPEAVARAISLAIQ